MMPMSLSKFSLNLAKCHDDNVCQRPLLVLVRCSLNCQTLLLGAQSVQPSDVDLFAVILRCASDVDGRPNWSGSYLLFHSGDQ